MPLFQVVFRSHTQSRNAAQPRVILYEDNWDDWRKYRTNFRMVVTDERGQEHVIGDVKLGKAGLLPNREVLPNARSPQPPEFFDRLAEEFFSVGQGEDYYQSLYQLDEDLRNRILLGLRDCAADLTILARYEHELVMRESLLRSVNIRTIRTRFHRIIQGNAALTNFHFSYEMPSQLSIQAPTLEFRVVPQSSPPTNVHVLIGRNGVGKTRCMRSMILALLGRVPPLGQSYGQVSLNEDPFEEWSFAGIVLVSFSAFDDFDINPIESDTMPCTVVGLRRGPTQQGERAQAKNSADLAFDFRSSLETCLIGVKARRWLDAISALEVDDLFGEINVSALAGIQDQPGWNLIVETLFQRLSSGHAIVLLTITKLVELVDEKTLVLLDEPESHLHPPLLSAFIRCLSDLLIKRNGVALVATHSPVVLQEVPQNCAWKLRRGGAVSFAERPTVETFGENIGVLTRDVFSLEVTRAGFHTLLASAVQSGQSFEEIYGTFGGQLGGEAQAILRALIADRDS